MRPIGLVAVGVILIRIGVALFGRPLTWLPPEPIPSAMLDDGYRRYAGALHVHTNASPDADGEFEDAVEDANEQALDYLVITDHGTLKHLREGRQGQHGPTLVLIGMEISLPVGHYLALNVAQEIDPTGRSAQQVIDAVAAQGGLGFIAHPHFSKHPWTDWSVRGFTGVEALSVAHDFIDGRWERVAWWGAISASPVAYHALLRRPDQALETWDRLLAAGAPVTGIGSTDAHEFHLLGTKYASYRVMFQLGRTYLLIPSETLTADAIYDALRRGHAYIASAVLGDPRDVTFMADDGRAVRGVMGDAVQLTPGLRLSVHAPSTAELALIKDGSVFATTRDHTWQVPVTEPGIYRLEVSLDGRPWILTNPIYVR